MVRSGLAFVSYVANAPLDLGKDKQVICADAFLIELVRDSSGAYPTESDETLDMRLRTISGLYGTAMLQQTRGRQYLFTHVGTSLWPVVRELRHHWKTDVTALPEHFESLRAYQSFLNQHGQSIAERGKVQGTAAFAGAWVRNCNRYLHALERKDSTGARRMHDQLNMLFPLAEPTRQQLKAASSKLDLQIGREAVFATGYNRAWQDTYTA